jgi:hypothetical protein
VRVGTPYAKVGVPEVWRYTVADGFAGFVLLSDDHRRIDTSRIIAGLPLNEIARRLASA